MKATKKKHPLIFEIKGNSLDDGPGIRTVVFFKGCPLSCIWCHNPESIKSGFELSFDKKLCIGCDACLKVCGTGALDRKNPFYVDRKKCTLCFKCVEQCPNLALAKVGMEMPVSEVMKKIEKDIPFYRTSGGGVTLSGGEATLFLDYTSDLAKKCKSRNIDVLLETNGMFNFESFKKKLYPYIDRLYYDIKFFDAEKHRLYCGISNETIIKNFIRLNSETKGKSKELLPRVPLIPDITATKENLQEIAHFLSSENILKVALLPNNPLWAEKKEKLGEIISKQYNKKLFKWIDKKKISYYRSFFKGFEII